MILELDRFTVLCGDMHGSPGNVMDKIIQCDLTDVDIIVLGDIGIWRYSDCKRGCFVLFDKFLAERNINCYAMRGNHDNPIFFTPENTHIQVDRFWSKFTNFKRLPDYTEINYDGRIGLAIGGGISVDRWRRSSFQKNRTVQNRFSYRNDDWWPNELVKLPPDETPKHYDFLLTHNGPTPPFLNHQSPIIKYYSEYDISLIPDIEAEQKKYELIYKQYTPDNWFMGHYHLSDSFYYGKAKCIILNEFELSELRLWQRLH